jgi:hypothetical protein
MSAPVPFQSVLKDKFAAGIVFRLLPGSLVALETPASTDPFQPYYQNRTQRILVIPGLAFRPTPNLSFGVGLNFFAELAGFVESTEGADRSLQVDVEEEILGLAKPHAGLRYDSKRFSLGLVYRDRFVLPFQTEVDTFVSDSNLFVSVKSRAFYTPATLVLGSAYRMDKYEFSLDLSWMQWSRYPMPFARVSAEVPLPSVGAGSTLNASSDFERVKTNDVIRVVLSGDYQLNDSLNVTAGYAFEPSPFEKQVGRANLVDSDKHIGALGVGWSGIELDRFRLGLNLAGQIHFVPNRTSVKDPTLLPDEDTRSSGNTIGRQTTNLGYPSIESGGLAFAAIFAVTIDILPADQVEEASR